MPPVSPAQQPSSQQAAAARLSVAQLRSAKVAGNDGLARLYARLANEHVNRRLADLRRRLP
jgi:hypothetical protein